MNQARFIHLAFLLLLPVCLGLGGCSARPDLGPDLSVHSGFSLDDYDDDPAGFSLDDYGDDGSGFSLDAYDDGQLTGAPSPVAGDPLEGWNRFWFGVNDKIYQDVLIPILERDREPGVLGKGLGNFGQHLRSPVRFANALLQGEFSQAGVEFGRFFVNTFMGLGFFNVADAQNPPLFPYTPDQLTFAHTLAAWGVPPGPYLVLPLAGPRTMREAVGLAGDMALNPQTYFAPWYVKVGSFILVNVSGDGNSLQSYLAVSRMAVDPYVAVRNAYLSNLEQRP